MAHAVVLSKGIIELLLDNVFIKLNATTSLCQNRKGVINMSIHSTAARGSHIKIRIHQNYSRKNLNMAF